MAVQFILGRSGAGKTHYCIRSIVEALLQKDDRPLLFLVPEQATYQAGRAILNDARISGYNRLHVLSFDRLVYLVSGKNTARPAISRLGRSMVIQRVVRDCAAKLKVFGSSSGPGLGKCLADTIARFQQYANTPDDVETIVRKLQKEKGDNLTAAKFDDIAIVFKEYLGFIEGKFLDPEIQLASACKAVAEADFVKGAMLWVDGFAGFTAGELALLTELLKAVKDAQIALCLDPAVIDLANPDKSKIDLTDLFGPTVQTFAELVERVKKCRLRTLKPLILDKPQRFRTSRPLSHIERCIFASSSPKISADGKIRIVCAPNARAEVRFVAQQITKLVRAAGCRYRDIAVIASDIDFYEHYIKASFEDYNIPVFVDKRRPLSQHPVIDFLCSALAAVTNDFAHNDVFAYLKTGLLDMEPDDIYLLENYCVAFGITGSDFQSGRPWQFAAGVAEKYHESRVEQIRQKAIAPLIQLQKQIGDAKVSLTAARFTKIIFDFLESAGVRDRLSVWIEKAVEKSDYAAADEHRQLYDRLVDVFDEFVEAFANVSMNCEDLLAIIKTAFSQMTLAFIPPNLDQVLVGSIERSRHPDLKAVFLIGATERQFPSPVVFDSILSEDDRLAAQALGLETPPGVRRELADRPYLAYIAFTRASDLLCITWPAVDGKSNAVVRSSYIDNLCQLFEDLEEESIAAVENPLEEIYSRYDLEDTLCRLKDQSLLNLAPRVASALSYENKAELDSDIVGKLFSDDISSSSSRLSTFAACPYKYFARYVLELERRKEFKLEPLDLGGFFHRALDGFLKKAVADKIDFETVEPAALIQILDEEIEKICSEDSFISKFREHGPHNAFMVDSAVDYLHNCVLAVVQMVLAGSFRPVMSEVTFGEPKTTGPTIGRFEIMLPDGRHLSLNGRIDRIDIAQIGGRKIALIFDYKSSEFSFGWPQFFYGLDIQLAVYMLAVRNASQKVVDDVAGAFYLPIRPKLDDIDISKTAADNFKFAHKARGIFNGVYSSSLDKSATKDSFFYNFYVKNDGDPYGKYATLGALRPADFETFMTFCTWKIAQLAGQIISGKISVQPYRLRTESPCSRCDYMPVCRFDWQLNDYNIITPFNKQQVLEKITNINEPKEN
ncbi:MAG: exodeoxyribonuclease V subunit gamma [Sedimentisphaerales bacterium]|nr:exodeoxyribonuclease V subunit gamma [Sedimentisphaerales bacterium]